MDAYRPSATAERVTDITTIHKSEYESEPEALIEAPGRAMLLGEHTEAFDGFFIAFAIDKTAQVSVSLRKDNSLRFYSADLGERKRATLTSLKYKREDRWANSPKGVIAGMVRRYGVTKGLNITIKSSIPGGIGFAATVAVEVATCLAAARAYGLPVGEEEAVAIAHEAETLFCGRKAPAINHYVCAAAREGEGLLVDGRDLGATRLLLSRKEYCYLVTDSKVPRLSIESELLSRRNDCRKCLATVSNRKPEPSFRDLKPQDIMESMGTLPERVRRRSLHVAEEIQRVRDAGIALAAGDMAGFGRIVNHSQDSLRDLYEVSCPEIDWLVKRALEMDAVLFSRMTGRGFGGCTLTMMRREATEEYKRRLEDYERIFGFRPSIFEVRPSDGAFRRLDAAPPRK